MMNSLTSDAAEAVAIALAIMITRKVAGAAEA